jgi:hypothetical protein
MKDSTLTKIINALNEADALLTDGEELSSLRREWGADDGTYKWAKNVRKLIQQLEGETK